MKREVEVLRKSEREISKVKGKESRYIKKRDGKRGRVSERRNREIKNNKETEGKSERERVKKLSLQSGFLNIKGCLDYKNT